MADRTPATPDLRVEGPRRLPHRSTKAGASTPATHERARLDAFLPPRSTKAGASTPATRASPSPRCAARSPLNEGRSVNPGDTPLYRHGRALLGDRSTKAGASTPATRLNSAKGQYRDKPSLVHGRGSLDDDVFAAISRDFGRYPVRMVRIKRRDCLDRGPSTRGFRESLRVRR